MTPRPAKVLYCHCAYAQVVPSEVKATVLRALCGSGVEFEAVSDLCELAARKDPRLQELSRGPFLKIAACYPRAVKGLFAAAGFPLQNDSCEILNMRMQSTAEITEGLLNGEMPAGLPVPSAPADQQASLGTPHFEPLKAKLEIRQPNPWLPWFPVIDFARCTHCMQCLSFCLFGVFGVDRQQHIQVQQPESCKTNCPACSRVCPDAAIMFPKYKTAPINGEIVAQADLAREKMKIDVSALLGGDVYQLLRERSERAKSRFSKERDPDKALEERKRCLATLMQTADIPPEVLMALPSPEEIQRKAKEAMARAQEALKSRPQP